MTHKSYGFTLIEVLLALGILAAVAGIIGRLQLRALTRVIHDRKELQHNYVARQELVGYMLKPPKKSKNLKKELPDASMTITTYADEIAKKSSLRQFAKVVTFVRARGQWQEGKVKHEMLLTSLMCTAALAKKTDEKK